MLAGKPVIKGAGMSVELLLDRFADGWSHEETLAACPHLTREQVLAGVTRKIDLCAVSDLFA